MNTKTLDPLQNPYHPFNETGRYRAFRDGWAAQRNGRVRTANPYSFSQVSKVLAWLDGWTAAANGTAERIDRRQRWAAHQIDALDFVWDQQEAPTAGVGA